MVPDIAKWFRNGNQKYLKASSAFARLGNGCNAHLTYIALTYVAGPSGWSHLAYL